MKVLLLSHNNTVQGMISLALHSVDHVSLVMSDVLQDVVDDNYDCVFVDDTISMYHESLALAKRLNSKCTVLLYQPGNTMLDGFDILISKPFLPDEITRLIKNYMESEPERFHLQPKKKSDKKKPKKKLKKMKKKNKRSKSNILNLNEIETIKALLEEDGLEIVHEEELAETVLSQDHSAESGKNNIKDELLETLQKMKPKKIRKLLRGAEVKISITFPKGI
jgi:flagellar motility protein MotE (MotC chaperone)